jgi:uncharacterized protein (TIGR03435 family)
MKLLVALVIILNAAGLLWSQTAPVRAPEFDVISIRPTTSDTIARPQLSCKGGRLLASNIPAQFLIEYAYSIRDTFPLPDWTRPDGDKYNIEAKADDESITGATCRLMTQRLLEDRFQLKLRKETRETAVFFLTVAKGGTTLKPVAPGSAATESSGAWWQGHRAVGGMRLPALVVNLNDLQEVGRRVVDKTGLPPDVFYEFHFDYNSGQGVPDIFEAMETQLGLKLNPGKAPVEFVAGAKSAAHPEFHVHFFCQRPVVEPAVRSADVHCASVRVLAGVSPESTVQYSVDLDCSGSGQRCH